MEQRVDYRLCLPYYKVGERDSMALLPVMLVFKHTFIIASLFIV